MRLFLSLALAWALCALPAAADGHDDGGYDEDDGYEDPDDYDDDEYEDWSDDGPVYDDSQVGAVQGYECEQAGQGSCSPADTPGQGIRK